VDPRYHASSSKAAIQAENEFAAHNYHPLPVVFAKAQGVNVWDPEGRKYLDFLSAYSAVNQGHCHPELVKVLIEQAGRLTLSSRAFHNDVFPRWAEKVRDLFGYDMVLPMCTGAEAVETAIKIARKWAYKGVEQNKALIFSAQDNFHGRTVCVFPRLLALMSSVGTQLGENKKGSLYTGRLQLTLILFIR
jgi:ornithine--oxo-acid transaminase